MPTPAIKHDDTRNPKDDRYSTTESASMRPCGCRFPTSGECECDTSCPYCWPEFADWSPDDESFMRWRPIRNAIICSVVIFGLLAATGLVWVHAAQARTNVVHPVPRPAGLLQAREQCPDTSSITECRAALRRALASIEWQRAENLKLARQMVGNVSAWTCIHNGKGASRGTGEGPWNDRGDPYWGGLQMDRQFMREYGKDMLAKHHGGLANTWTPREQLIVAQRAYAQGRGYNPWPTTGRACGLIR